MEKDGGAASESEERTEADRTHMTDMEGLPECIVAEVKTEVISLPGDTLTIAPQQYIILARNDSEDGTTLEPTSKYIRLEGDDGQTYVLAVTVADSVCSEDSGALGQVQVKTDDESAITAAAISAEKSGCAGDSAASSDSEKQSAAAASSLVAEGVNQTWFTTRDDKHAYQKGGHRWKQGQWTQEEIDLLQNNITQYCKDENISDPREIIFEMTKDERKDFYRTIARGLQRPLFSVYRRVTRMYDQKNHMGKYTQDEIKKLRELRAKHGNDWAAIGLALGRSASSVKDKCRLMKDNCNSGKWYPEEERRLAQAIYNLTGIKPSESITQGLSWAAVADQVGTRSEKQCRTKWLNYLNWKQQGGADWTRQDDLTLIQKISKLNVSNDTEIDWNELAKNWTSVRSPQWLRGKWWSLKRHVSGYQHLSFQDLLDSLLAMQYQNVKMKSAMRVTRVDIPSSGAAGEMALHIPVSLQAGLDSGGEDSESFQAFEVLQQWTPSSSTAFLITQPCINTTTTSPSSSQVDATPGLGGDHIIVQALPVVQDSSKMENVKVQLNPQPQQVIIRTSEHEGVTELDQSLTIHLPDGLSHSERILAEDESIAGEASMDEDDLTTGTHIRDQQIIDSESSYEVQVVSGSVMAGSVGGVEMEEAVVSGGDLVIGCGAVSSPPHFMQSSSNDAEIMTSLSDPILTSNEADLMGNSSDLESEKVHGHGLGDDLQ
ncbi:cyclin-D-binding Myb-like transcription factor 1 isoform X2 [Pomacea canaliculata]|uniref:cyclin-D-binding Myb-like transcription factor 1 isoform X2 n=1 Tax=Pomacea canaliculata TaxID=400727 RepID=UPI000D72CC2F|nr:cyclin-D-binding Myb-like transcription factor 1 isoform X2 [Pomacea canaliculata]